MELTMKKGQYPSSNPDKQEGDEISVKQYKDIVNHANQEIDHVRSIYKLLGTLLTINFSDWNIFYFQICK